MQKKWMRLVCLCLGCMLAWGSLEAPFCAKAEEDALADVTAQLEKIDSLQDMQDKRGDYSVKSRYDAGMTDAAVIAEHQNARNGYESYVSEMFAARAAAQQAYDALSDAQKGQVDASLVEKLNDRLSTVLHGGTFAVTPGEGAYVLEAVNGGTGYGYEVSNHMVSGEIPQTFILVDTSDGKTSWTPSGKYVPGSSNYEVAYCCDVMTPLRYTTDYRRVNLEDSGYYGKQAARKIRAILQNAYPFVSLSEMKENLKAGGLNAEFVNSLTRADVIAAVQMAVWTYANAGDGAADGLGYFSSIDVTANSGLYFTPLHDYTNECWEWFPSKRMRSYDARAEYRVNTLAYYLCTLPGADARDAQVVISDVQVTRASLMPGTDGLYELGMYVYIHNSTAEDDLKVSVVSYQTLEDGTKRVTDRQVQQLSGNEKLFVSVKAQTGDDIQVVVEGTQNLARGVYFYEPKGGRSVSQSLVGVSQGRTHVYAEENFLFTEEVGASGLRIYKSEAGSGLPISDITFSVYTVQPEAGKMPGAVPTQEEIAAYATEKNLAATLVTDVTGYAAAALAEGLYLVVEEQNASKVKAPVPPFYLQLPLTVEMQDADGHVYLQTMPVAAVYPKNETVQAPEDSPELPVTPDRVTGRLAVVKHEEGNRDVLLSGAQFQVYRAARTADADTEMLEVDGVKYAAIPVWAGENRLVLTTDEKGYAVSPDLSCGTYFLKEIQAPEGYDLLEDAVKVFVHSSEMTSVATVEIANRRGVVLPETGGSGTYAFAWPGAILLLTGGALLLWKKRRAA